MWKHLTETVRQVLEKGLGTSRVARTQVKVSKPCLSRICSTRLTTFLSNKVNTDDYGEAKQKYSKAPPYKLCEAWLGAFSYGGAVALGWFIVHPVNHLKKWRAWNRERRRARCAASLNLQRFLLSRLVITQPLQVAYTNLNGTVTTEKEIEQPTQFGPCTAQEALDEAAEGLKVAHDSLLGEVENLQGVNCIHRKKNREAVQFFMAASRHGYAPAAYNLAQCYELGLGLKQDFEEASKWYKVASDAGHAGAMYNLGVYYAHGWGGLAANSVKARELFSRAASRGQSDAIAALGISSASSKESDRSLDLFSEADHQKNHPVSYLCGAESFSILDACTQDSCFILKVNDLDDVKEKRFLISYAVGLLADLFYQPKVPRK